MENPIENKAQNQWIRICKLLQFFCDRIMKARSRQNIWRERALKQDIKKFRQHGFV